MNNNTNANIEIKTVYMKEWFYRKNQYDRKYGPYSEHSCIVRKETEKAYQVIVWCQHSWTCWIPKSCTLNTIDEVKEEIRNAEIRQAEYEAKRQERWEAACKAYADLIAYAKAHGVKGVREGLRRETIEQKIISAGIALPA